MKKFICGLTCGILLSASITVAFGAQGLTAYLFPSKIMIHIGDSVKELEMSGDKIINYNNKVYVPLRVFARAMSSYVTYQAPSTTENFNKIDVYVVGEKDFPIRDTEGYVSMKITKEESKDGRKKVSGLIRVNRDMSGKKVEIGDSLVIQNELFQPLKAGDIRAFSTDMDIQVSGYPVVVNDAVSSISSFGAPIMGLNGDIGLVFAGIENGTTINISKDKVMNTFSSICIYNFLQKNITLKPLDIDYQIIKINKGKDELICDYKLSKAEVKMLGNTYYTVHIPMWDFKDKTENLVDSGKYAIQIKFPANFEYYIEGSNALKTIPIEENMFNKRYEFNLVK